MASPRSSSAPINFRTPAGKANHSLGCSPTSSGGSFGGGGGSGSKKDLAKSFFAKVKYSDLPTSEYEVGLLMDKSSSKSSRHSGRYVVDVPFDEFAARDDKAFHRVRYFKREGVIVWESPSKRYGGSSPGGGSFAGLGSSPTSHGHLMRLHLGNSREGSPDPSGASYDRDSSTSPWRGTEDVLPDEAWCLILAHVGAKELCVMSAVSKHLNRTISSNAGLWRHLYRDVFGALPEDNWSVKVIKHVLCKSERSASKWLDAEPSLMDVGFPNTAVLDVDDSHVISGDGNELRVWVHKTDRRIKTLKGHMASISCVGFDSTHISSGDVTGHLKLWSVDELRNIRSLRAHADSVSDTLHFNQLCVTCSLDGFIKVWDATQAHPLVVDLDGGSRIYNMCMHSARNRLYSVGMDIEGWDLETARSCMQIQEEDAMLVDPDAYYGYPVDVWPGTGNASKAVATNGTLLASAGKGIVNLYDTRTHERCCTWSVAGGGERENGAEGGMGGGGGGGGRPTPVASAAACTGLELDDWKLVCGFRDVRKGAVFVYDIRAASSSQGRVWVPTLALSPSGKQITCFRVFDSYVVAGVQGEACLLWNFDRSAGGIPGNSDSDDEKVMQRRKNRSMKKCPKQRKRYPKRATR